MCSKPSFFLAGDNDLAILPHVGSESSQYSPFAPHFLMAVPFKVKFVLQVYTALSRRPSLCIFKSPFSGMGGGTQAEVYKYEK